MAARLFLDQCAQAGPRLALVVRLRHGENQAIVEHRQSRLARRHLQGACASQVQQWIAQRPGACRGMFGLLPFAQLGQHPACVAVDEPFDIGVTRLDRGRDAQAAGIDGQSEGTPARGASHHIGYWLAVQDDFMWLFGRGRCRWRLPGLAGVAQACEKRQFELQQAEHEVPCACASTINRRTAGALAGRRTTAQAFVSLHTGAETAAAFRPRSRLPPAPSAAPGSGHPAQSAGRSIR